VNLSRFAQKWYEVEIFTDPQILTGWEATFDDGTSWIVGEVVADPVPAPANPGAVVVRWLLAGPDAPPLDQVPDFVITAGVQPVLRAPAEPEAEALTGPMVILQ
jgi:hypothetical protein